MTFIAILLLALPLILLISALQDGWAVFNKIFLIKKRLLGHADKERIRKYLSQLGYYRQLSPKSKDIFLDRVLTFIYCKNFAGKKGLEVTEEMKALISASAVQLTFGMKRFKLENLETINIYPESFYMGPEKKEYKGGTSQGGTMYLSWKDFKEGYLDPDDQYNLGLHEMSHALKLSVLMDNDFDAHFGSYLDEWIKIADNEFDRMRHGKPSFLRSYAKTNRHEFFAVCVEHFFETPAEFRTALPDVYNHLALLLNQNPLNTSGDYKLDEFFIHDTNKKKENIPLPKEIKKNFKYASWHWSLTVLMIGIPVLGITFFTLYRETVLPWEVTLLLFLACGAPALLQWNHFKRTDALDRSKFLLYTFFGFGACIFSLVIWLNHFVPVSEPETETYRIESYEREYNRKKHGGKTLVGYTLHLEDETYSHYPITFVTSEPYNVNKVAFVFQRGLFGIRVLKGYYYIREGSE